MGKITQILLVEILELLFLELLACVMRSKLGLDFNGGSFLAFELFSFKIHFEFGLNFERSLGITFPIFLGLISAIVV